MFSRAIVVRCARTMRSTMKAPIAAVSVAAVFEIVQRRGADLEPALVAVVPLGDARIEIPAVVVEPRRRRRCAGRPSSVRRLQLAEADDDVGDLDAGVVDVVLHFDRRAAESQHADERVAERRVSQVADVRRLVRVDGRVLDDGLVADAVSAGLCGRQLALAGRADEERRPVEIEVQVAVRRGDDARSTPAIASTAGASSCAIARGALRSVRASWNATVTARSPSARLGGVSTANAGTSATPNWRRTAASIASCTRC